MIIKNKVDIDGWRFDVRCDKCETVMQIDYSDLRSEHLPPDRNDPAVTVFHINCGVCSAKIPILTNAIPKAVQIEVLAVESGKSKNRSGFGISSTSLLDNLYDIPWGNLYK